MVRDEKIFDRPYLKYFLRISSWIYFILLCYILDSIYLIVSYVIFCPFLLLFYFSTLSELKKFIFGSCNLNIVCQDDVTRGHVRIIYWWFPVQLTVPSPLHRPSSRTQFSPQNFYGGGLTWVRCLTLAIIV